MADLDTLNVTDSGLFNINKKIINSRTYASNLITVAGSPTILNGIASELSSESYLFYSPLNLEETSTLSVNFKGNFTESSSKQCLWELTDNSSSSLYLYIENNTISLMYNAEQIFSFKNLNFSDNEDLKTYLTLKTNSYTFTLNYGNKVLQKSGEFNFNIPLSTFTTINIGSSSANRNNFWEGSIDLKELSLYKNGEFVYSPSEGTSWNFSNILISDGTFPLTDSTQPAAKHIYSYPITEISRSNNTILLTCQIDESSYLTIKEIGLYINTPNGKVLFGSIGNLNINKSKDLSYNLVFTVNTSISVVNAIGFPAENGIIVKDPEFVEFKDYTTIEQVCTYVFTNLERIIRMNAGAKGSYVNTAVINSQAGIGYNRPQVIYRLQQEIEKQEDCFNSVDTFAKLVNRFQKIIEKQIDYDAFEIEGDLSVPTNGEVQGFTTTDYITKGTPFEDTKKWEINTSFTTDEETTNGTILSLSNRSSYTPMEVSALDGNCYLHINRTESINPSTLDSYYFRTPSGDTSTQANFIAVTQEGYVLSSSDGIEWAEEVKLSNLFLKIAYGNGKFIIINNHGSVYTSVDGKAWLINYSTISNVHIGITNWIGLTYGNGKFVALSANNYASTSVDGESWTPSLKIVPGSTDHTFTSLSYGNGKFIALSSDGYFYTSIDGMEWTAYGNVPSGSGIWESVLFVNNRFCAVSTDGYISTSPTTSSNWTYPYHSLPFNNGVICFNNNLCVTCSASGDKFYTSADLETWEEHSTADYPNWSSIIWVPSTSYYAWQESGNMEESLSTYYNFHCNLPPSTSPLVQFPQNNDLILKHNGMNSSNFTLSIRALISDVNDTQYLLGGDINCPSSIKLFVQNKKLYAHLYEFGSQSLITDSLVSRYNLKPNRYYNITLSYNGEEYSLHYEMEPLEGEYKEEETIFVYSNDKISLREVNTLSIGYNAEWNTNYRAFHRNGYVHIAKGNNILVTIDDFGYVSTSTDGVTWTIPVENSNLGRNSWSAITYGNGKFVALNLGGYISTSTDGTTWTPAVLNNNLGYKSWSAITYGNGKFVALSSSGYISTSTDGTTWTPAVLNTNLGNRNWSSITCGNGKFVALTFGTGNNLGGYISTSTDGTTWSSATQNINLGSNYTNYWMDLSYGNGKFVALGRTGYISTSTDGTTWSSAHLDDALRTQPYWSSIIYNNGEFITINPHGYMATSTDSLTWKVYGNSTETSKKPLIAHGNGKFLIIYRDLENTTVTFSPDGYAWSYQQPIQGLDRVDPRGGCLYFANDRFNLITYTGDEYTSPDGITWEYHSRISTFSYNRNSEIACGNGVKVAIRKNDGYYAVENTIAYTPTYYTNLGEHDWSALSTGNGTIVALGRTGYISTSTDGTTWTEAAQNANLGENRWVGIAYGNEKFVAIGNEGYISTSTDGTTWSTAEINETLYGHSWTSLIYNGTMFVALDLYGYIATSTNGTTWTYLIDHRLGPFVWTSITYDGLKFLVSSEYGSVYTSPDGITWTQEGSLDPNQQWESVIYNRNFTALSTDGYISTSIDGTEWNRTSLNIHLENDEWFSLTPLTTNNSIALSKKGAVAIIRTQWSDFSNSLDVRGGAAGIVFDGEKFIVIDYSSYLYTSTNGEQWSELSVIPTLLTDGSYSNWSDLLYGDNKFIIIGENNKVSTSTDGITWTIPSKNGPNLDSMIGTYGNGKFVEVGQQYLISVYPSKDKLNGIIDFSNFYIHDNDRNSWEGISNLDLLYTEDQAPESSNIVYDKQKYTIQETYVGDYTGGTLISETLFPIEENTKYDVNISYSEDEETQEGEYTVSKMENNDETSKEVIFSKTVTIEDNLSNRMSTPSSTVVGISPVKTKSIIALNRNGYISTSINGTTWTPAVSNANLNSNNWQSLAYDGTKFVALGRNGYISTSIDGTTWTEAAQNANLGENSWSAITYGNGKFVALNLGGYISTSTDGTTWTPAIQSISRVGRDLAYGGNKFVALGYGGYISTSIDGTTWTPAIQNTNLGNHSWEALAYGDSKFVALDYDGYISTSIDGTTWTPAIRNTNLGSNEWSALTYDGTKFVALSSTGYISTSIDGTTWTPAIQAIQNTNWGMRGWRALSSSPFKEEPSNPYSSTINLLPWKIQSHESTYTFSKNVELRNTELLQYYRIPDLNKNQYIVKDLCNLNRTIRFLNDKFEGNQDSINLLYPEGLTLCMKVDLKDTEPKSILYKSDLVQDVYCSLTFNNQTLSFTVMTPYGTQSISKKLELEDYASYIDAPALITIIVDHEDQGYVYISMYKNNELVIKPTYAEISSTADPSTFVLSNYIEGDTEEGKYLSDLVVIKGIISQDDLNYINNLFDTNY